jgi:ribokinase
MSTFIAQIWKFVPRCGSIMVMTRLRDIDVLVVGDTNPDLILRGDVVPRFGQSEQLLDSAELTIGGSGAIVAHGLARLGMRVVLVSVIGDDAFGALCRDRLGAVGVDVGALRTDRESPTGLSVILAHGGSRTTLTLRGAIASLDGAEVTDELLARARHVHASSFYLQPRLAAGLPELFRRAHEHGVSTSLDTNFDPAEGWAGLDDVLPVTDVLLPNRTEILGTAGRFGHSASGGDPVENLVAAAGVIADLGPLVVVKDGERGAVAVGASSDGSSSGSRDVIAQPGQQVEAVDSTGAGDSFDAAFLAGRVRGLPLAECLALACRAGAWSTLGLGGTGSQATWAQLQQEPVAPAPVEVHHRQGR